MEGALQSEFGEKIRNLTGILQDKFPSVDISDIPGLNTGGDLTPTIRSSNFAIFMCSLIFGMFWITSLMLFNARVVGSIITKIANKFVSEGYFKVSPEKAKTFNETVHLIKKSQSLSTQVLTVEKKDALLLNTEPF